MISNLFCFFNVNGFHIFSLHTFIICENYKLISLFLKQICIFPIHTEACSWRSGSRCYPGTCSDTTTNSCQCSEGFSGADCDISNLFVIMWILNCKKAKKSSLEYIFYDLLNKTK